MVVHLGPHAEVLGGSEWGPVYQPVQSHASPVGNPFTSLGDTVVFVFDR